MTAEAGNISAPLGKPAWTEGIDAVVITVKIRPQFGGAGMRRVRNDRIVASPAGKAGGRRTPFATTRRFGMVDTLVLSAGARGALRFASRNALHRYRLGYATSADGGRALIGLLLYLPGIHR